MNEQILKVDSRLYFEIVKDLFKTIVRRHNDKYLFQEIIENLLRRQPDKFPFRILTEYDGVHESINPIIVEEIINKYFVTIDDIEILQSHFYEVNEEWISKIIGNKAKSCELKLESILN